MKGAGIRIREEPRGSNVWVGDDAGKHVCVPIEVLDSLESFARRIIETYGAPTNYPGALYVLQWMRRNGFAMDIDEWEEDADERFTERGGM